MKIRVGHNVFGLAAIVYGIVILVWHQIDAFGNLTHPAILIYGVGVAEFLGGLALQWPRTMRLGAQAVGAVFSIFALYWIVQIVRTPLVFDPWGIFGEQFSIALGGVLIFASTMPADPQRAAMITKAAYTGFGICVVTFALYQLSELTYTAGLVPKWIPPSQMFWAVATTVLFALAAVALLSGRLALLAAQLLTAMLVLFGILVWLPAIFANPRKMSNWQEFAANLAIAASSWIVADFLWQPNRVPRRWPFVHTAVKRRAR